MGSFRSDPKKDLKIRYIKTGGDEGVRTPDPLLAKQVLSQLSYIPNLVGPSGIEPETSALSAQRSNQLSYGPSVTTGLITLPKVPCLLLLKIYN